MSSDYFGNVLKISEILDNIDDNDLFKNRDIIFNLIGINNRNLEDFSVSLETTKEILAARGEELQQRNILVVSESGLHTAQDLKFAQQAGANAVLIGESLVKQEDIEGAVNRLFT